MPKIHYLTDGQTIEIGSDTTLLRASLDHGIAHTHVCGGNAKCSTCRVLVIEGLGHCCRRNEREARLAGDRKFGADIRLACQTTVSGDVTLRRLVLDAEDIVLVDAEARGAAVGSAWEQVHGKVCCGRVLEVALKGKSGKYPLYEITALAEAGA